VIAQEMKYAFQRKAIIQVEATDGRQRLKKS
jgi:hypothetical protein